MTDYKNTLNLPQTAFSMKANLSQQEPKRLIWWDENKIYQKIRLKMQNKEKFILHDGPPYANGNLHCGHALNKILKDLVIKSKTLSGFDAPFIHGWDCHGLPIEINVEKKIGKVGKNVSPETFRKACREYAASYIKIQKDELKRLGVFGDWDNPYSTMDYSYEASIVRVLAQLIKSGLVYQGLKPVHWCIDCGSALAEAEVEYENKKSPSIDVAFYAEDTENFVKLFNVQTKNKPLIVPIWTTTPWTLPANEAICLHKDLFYGLYETQNSYFLLAKDLSANAFSRYAIQDAVFLGEVKGLELENLRCKHPFLEKSVPIILGDHVTLEAGTGCVHTAPSHGVEDYEVALKYHIACKTPVLENGCFNDETPFFAGIHLTKANPLIIEKLQEKKALLAIEHIEHSYPHCWRHKSPMIFLTTPQWFISMDNNNLRNKILAAIEKIKFIPDWGQVRLANMVSSRPDWCISRQRNWGTPIPIFIHKKTKEIHPDTPLLMEKVADLINKNGIEAWFALDPKTLLGIDAENYSKITDTLDVWFDAGSSYFAVLMQNNNLKFPADLYLEGSDQYRGWFNSSLTNAVAKEGVAPYKMVLSHGYTVDAHGKKLSKSQGNYIPLDKMVEKYGAEIIRLWVTSTDYRHEVSISDEILTRLSDSYRRIRNTARFLLANLFDFEPEKHSVPANKLIALDAYILAYAEKLQTEIIKDYDAYQFHLVYQKIHHFCAIIMGSFYLDIIKDRQYTTGKNSTARRSCQTAMYHILQALTRWIAPFLSYTAEEIYQEISTEESIFLTTWYDAWPKIVNIDMQYWDTLRNIRDEVNKALESAREAKIIGSGLAASVTLYANDELYKILAELKNELKFFLITSNATVKPLSCNKTENVNAKSISPSLAIDVEPCNTTKCIRCWHRCDNIGQNKDHQELCLRCANTVTGQDEERCFV